MIRIKTPARVGVLGNPSDGYYGKTISIPVRKFFGEVVLFEWKHMEILPGPSDNDTFDSLDDMVKDIKINGYYGGYRLIKAAIKVFYEYAKEQKLKLHNKNFTIRYDTTIPRQVGLAGSSGIITPIIKALTQFYKIEIPKEIMPNVVLKAETEELGISAGLQDRVVQVYDSPVYMDFNKQHMEKKGYGIYKVLPEKLFPPMYLIYRTTLTHKDIAHNNVRERWEGGEKLVIDTMNELADNTDIGLKALEHKDYEKYDQCLDRNFDLRSKIYDITEENMELITTARKLGATAKFSGSGGAIIGTYKDDRMLKELTDTFNKMDCEVVTF